MNARAPASIGAKEQGRHFIDGNVANKKSCILDDDDDDDVDSINFLISVSHSISAFDDNDVIF